jgi:predicted amidohydrolase YtcJ
VNRALIIANGKVLTMDEAHPESSALYLKGGRIDAVSDDSSELVAEHPGVEVLDAGGATVMPGIVDAHNHIRLGANRTALQLADATSLDAIRERISHHLDATPAGTWIEAEGWNYAAVPGGRPNASMIDDVCRDRPAWIFSYDVHTVWLNSAGLRRFGIDARNPSCAFGRVELDERGEPTGWIHDFAVRGIHPDGQAVLEAELPGYHPDAQYERVSENLRAATAFGITTVVEPQNGISDIALFERAWDEGVLNGRLIAAMIFTPESRAGALDELDAFIKTYSHDAISVGPIKLYIDDVIEPHTAAMIEPYANFPGRGSTFWPPEAFASLVLDLEQRGLQAFVHSTGDRGIRTALDGFQSGRRAHGIRDARHQLVHVECLHEDDIARFNELGVVACMQPRHCGPDIVTEWRENVGPERERYAWAMRSLLDAGAPVAFSSDWNVAEMDPLIGIYSALTRADLHGANGWNKEETITFHEAVAGYTKGSAWANFLDREVGTLAPGFRGDVVIFDRDLTNIDEPAELLEASVAATIVDGDVVYEASRA